MLADVRILFNSDIYQLTQFNCRCDICSLSQTEYNEHFSIDFIQAGFFEYRTFRRKEESHTGRVLISKPNFPHTTRHIDGQPDITTTIKFSFPFYQQIINNYIEAGWFLKDPDLHSMLINSSAELDHIHHLLMQQVRPRSIAPYPVNHQAPAKLYVDDLVLKILDMTMGKLGNIAAAAPVPTAFKLFHLPAIEQAQDYLLRHYREDISLQQLARHCHSSPFHFSRLFKAVLGVAPHQYLLGIRLHQAKRLLTDSQQAVSDIAFACGFNSLEHFATAFRKRYKVSPSTFRRQVV